jgi:hypothetical protein
MPITFLDALGVLWCYYLRLHCDKCHSIEMHLISPCGDTLRCGTCRHTEAISAREYIERV